MTAISTIRGNSWITALILAGAVAIFAAVAIGERGPLLAIIGVGAVPVVLITLQNQKLGSVVVLVLAFVLLGVKKAIGAIPLGLALDGLILLLFLGFTINSLSGKRSASGKIVMVEATHAVIVIWIVYNLLEGINPNADSRLAWLYTIRSGAGFMVMYFVYASVIKTKSDLKLFVNLWIGLCLAGGLYGLYQEYVGFLPFEERWIMSDPRRYALLFIMGRFRKFSFFAGPMEFGILMSVTSVVALVLAYYAQGLRRWYLIGSAVVMLMGMVFSGTRAAYVLPPAGMVFFAVLSQSRKAVLAMVVLGLLGALVIVVPSSNPNIIRIQTAFQPGEDASYKVRKRNQARIKPFIQNTPMGGGMGSVGVWGERFSPGSFLSTFPPDSGFVRTAVEMGWVGLLLYCTLLFVFFHVGLFNHFALTDPELRGISAALLTGLFMLTLANFPQEAIGALPISLLFFLVLAMMSRIKAIEITETKLNLNPNSI